MKCTDCDAENMEGAGCCWECGASFRSPIQKSSQSGWIIWSVLGLAGLAVVVMMLNAGSSGGGGAPVAAGPNAATASAGATTSVGATRSPAATYSVPPSVSTTGPSTP